MSDKKYEDFKPWEWYPHLFKTEGAFWMYLRGSLRRGLWEKSYIKLDFKNKHCGKPPLDYQGRGRRGGVCYLTNKWTMISHLEVDHLDGHKPLLCVEDILPYIMHLVPPPNSLGLAEKEAHKIKSYSERMGITYEEAVIVKKAIAIGKGDDKGWLKKRGVVPESNATKRRKQIVDYLRNNP